MGWKSCMWCSTHLHMKLDRIGVTEQVSNLVSSQAMQYFLSTVLIFILKTLQPPLHHVMGKVVLQGIIRKQGLMWQERMMWNAWYFCVQLIRNLRSLITDKASGFCSLNPTIFQSDVITEKSSLAGSIKFPLILPPLSLFLVSWPEFSERYGKPPIVTYMETFNSFLIYLSKGY